MFSKLYFNPAHGKRHFVLCLVSFISTPLIVRGIFSLFGVISYRYATWYFAFVVVDFLFTRLIAGGAEVDDQIGGKPGAGAREPPGGHGSWRQRLRMRQHSRRAGREQHPTCACLAPHQAAH